MNYNNKEVEIEAQSVKEAAEMAAAVVDTATDTDPAETAEVVKTKENTSKKYLGKCFGAISKIATGALEISRHAACKAWDKVPSIKTMVMVKKNDSTYTCEVVHFMSNFRISAIKALTKRCDADFLVSSHGDRQIDIIVNGNVLLSAVLV